MDRSRRRFLSLLAVGSVGLFTGCGVYTNENPFGKRTLADVLRKDNHFVEWGGIGETTSGQHVDGVIFSKEIGKMDTVFTVNGKVLPLPMDKIELKGTVIVLHDNNSKDLEKVFKEIDCFLEGDETTIIANYLS